MKKGIIQQAVSLLIVVTVWIAFGDSMARADNAPGVVYRTVTIKDVDIFYRESVDSSRLTIPLPHGFPTALHKVSVNTGVRILSDTFNPGSGKTSESLSLFVQLTNRAPFEWLVEDRNYYSIDLSVNYEPDAEKFDIDRANISSGFSASFQRPFMRTAADTLISVVAAYEYHENAQQTEEFEKTIYSGLAFDRYFGWFNNVTTWGGTGALACSEEEKDDERPRILFGIDRSELNRKGCGYFIRLHAETVTPLGLVWAISVDNYTGDYGVKHYRRQRFSTNVTWIMKNNNSCDASYRFIRRNSERDFIGMDDNFYQFGFGCSHRL